MAPLHIMTKTSMYACNEDMECYQTSFAECITDTTVVSSNKFLFLVAVTLLNSCYVLCFEKPVQILPCSGTDDVVLRTDLPISLLRSLFVGGLHK